MKHLRGCKNNVFTGYYNTPGKNLFSNKLRCIMLYLYIIHSETADKYYVGHSDNPDRRLIEHNTKPFNTYTSKFRPWTLKVKIPVGQNRSHGILAERWIKKKKSRIIIEEIIKAQTLPYSFYGG
jgi:putative endonuclease